MSKHTPAPTLATISAERTLEAKAIIAYLKEVVIADDEQYTAGAEQLVELKQQLKDLKAERTDLLEPHKAAQKAVTNETDGPIKLFEQAEAVMKDALLRYTREKEALVQKQLAAAYEAGKTDEGASHALSLIEQATYKPEAKGLSYRNYNVVEVTDASLIPRQFMEPDMKRIEAAIKAGIEVPGVTVRVEQRLAVRT